MNDLIFWKHWENCKYIADGMQKALEKAKANNPNIDYTEAENKIKILADIQVYLGELKEENTILKRLNLEHGEKYGKVRDKLIEASKTAKNQQEEINNLKQNITI